MMRFPRLLLIATFLLFAVVIQTTLFGQFRFVVPDLVLLVVILLALTRIRPEAVLGIAFAAGLLVDLLGSSLVGLRAVVFTTVAYLAIRTRERAEVGRYAVGLWVGGLTLVALVLISLIATLFGQSSLIGADFGTKLIVIPIANLILATLLSPLFVRVIDRDARGVRFT